ncbi:hypothetical protein VNI00_009595 [Paramarasmius palmivorus]|uniref:Uncharacterized protein n=1 Tax=Paramarasmius palmivorus TaxID=297713 RepID=A0AAW0CQ29_9AGAR
MPLDHVSLHLSNLISVALECGVYGASLPFFGYTLHELFRRDKEKGEKINKTLVSLALAFWLLSTITVVADTTNGILGFTTYFDVPEYLEQASRPGMTTSGLSYNCITILADAVVAYRCFVVWKSNWIVRVIPWVLWLVLIAASTWCWVMLFIMERQQGYTQIQLGALWQPTTAFFAASLAANFVSTGLLAYKIWRITGPLSSSKSVLRKFTRVVIDSGVIYTVFLIIAMIVFITGSNLQYVSTNIMSGVISIAFYLTIIRLQRSNRKRFSVKSAFDYKDTGLKGLSVPKTRTYGQSFGVAAQSLKVDADHEHKDLERGVNEQTREKEDDEILEVSEPSERTSEFTDSYWGSLSDSDKV